VPNYVTDNYVAGQTNSSPPTTLTTRFRTRLRSAYGELARKKNLPVPSVAKVLQAHTKRTRWPDAGAVATMDLRRVPARAFCVRLCGAEGDLAGDAFQET